MSSEVLFRRALIVISMAVVVEAFLVFALCAPATRFFSRDISAGLLLIAGLSVCAFAIWAARRMIPDGQWLGAFVFSALLVIGLSAPAIQLMRSLVVHSSEEMSDFDHFVPIYLGVTEFLTIVTGILAGGSHPSKTTE